jgi:hypothetical protein
MRKIAVSALLSAPALCDDHNAGHASPKDGTRKKRTIGGSISCPDPECQPLQRKIEDFGALP